MKIDFEIAYECVGWSYPRYLLDRLMFGGRNGRIG